MEKKDIILLRTFLKKKNAWETYVTNVRMQNRKLNRAFFPFAELKRKRDIIDYSFTWSETPQGHDYWEKLHYEYRTMLNETQSKQ